MDCGEVVFAVEVEAKDVGVGEEGFWDRVADDFGGFSCGVEVDDTAPTFQGTYGAVYGGC